MKVLSLFVFILFFKETNSQLPSFKSILVGKDTLYYTQPITNREYLTFLLHNYKIFGESYGNYIYSLFPLVKINYNEAYNASRKSNLLAVLIQHSDPLIKNYIFNPKYFDYPVIGISQFQANHFSHWYTDRLNENKLVDEGIIKLDFASDVDDNHFSTEAYIVGQYEPTRGEIGITKKINGLKFALEYKYTMYAISKLFTFGLRLPTVFELKKLSVSEKPLFKAYPKKDFIQMWEDSFINIRNHKLVCNVDYDSIIFTGKNMTNVSFKGELSFGYYKDSNFLDLINNELLELNNWPQINFGESSSEKNEYGYLDCRFLGYNEHNDLITLYDKKDKWSRNSELKPFRLVFNKRITTGMEKRIEYIPMPK